MVGSWIPDLGGAGLGSGCGRIDDLIEANAHCKCSKSWSKMVDSWILKLGGGGLGSGCGRIDDFIEANAH